VPNLPLASDGSFRGEGTDDHGFSNFGTTSVRYTISGQVTGAAAQGKFSLHWEELGFSSYPVVSTWQIFCGGEVTWTAQRQ
jgi:hypothetical protein